MTLATLPMLLYIFPAFTILAALLPPRWKQLALGSGGLTIVGYLGGFPAVLMLTLSVCSTWLILRMQPLRSGTHHRRADLWQYAGISMQLLWLLICKFTIGGMSLLPMLLCSLQGIECILARAQHKIPIPSLYHFFCYQCDMTRLFSCTILPYTEYEAHIRQRQVTAERVGQGAGMCIRGIFQLVCLSLPMQTLQAQLLPSVSVITAFDVLFSVPVFFFAVYFGLKGASQLGQGIACMLGIVYPDCFDAPILSTSLHNYAKRFMSPVSGWIQRVLLTAQAEQDYGTYFTRIALLLGCGGFLFGNAGGLLWGIATAAALTAERKLSPKYGGKLPAPASCLLTNAIVLIGLIFVSSGSIIGMLSEYGALLGINGAMLSSTAEYLLHTNWLTLILCIIGLFPIRRIREKLPQDKIYIRLLRTAISAAMETGMLLFAYAELLSRYLRS
ncbi:MAG TPA: hypothetical protein DCG49_00625 [Ruminococcus sp.]|nr:hypothetical protein [Ruminococcus sp.]